MVVSVPPGNKQTLENINCCLIISFRHAYSCPSFIVHPVKVSCALVTAKRAVRAMLRIESLDDIDISDTVYVSNSQFDASTYG